MTRAKSFVLWTLLVSVTYALVFILFLLPRGVPFIIMATGYMLLPGIISLVLLKKEKRSLKELNIFFRPNRWFVFAWLIFVVLSFLTIPVNTIFFDANFSLSMEGFFEQYRDLLSPEQFLEMQEQVINTPWLPLLLMLGQGLVAGLTINAFFAFGEELGWRGYLYQELQSYGFWKNSLITGFIWGIWHTPMIMLGHNYPGYPFIGTLMMIIWCILLSPLFTLIRQKSGSVIAAAIAHGTLNAVAGLSVIYVVGGGLLLNGILGLSGFVLLAVVNLILYFFQRKGVL